MPSFETALGFFGIALLLGFAPGPDNLFVMLQSAAHGRKAGLWVMLGLCTGLVVHTSAVALGLAAVFAASVWAFAVVKSIGAAYLCWLAWQAWRAPVHTATGAAWSAPSATAMYLRGLLMNLSNPKVVLFFLAFLPQFVRAEAGPVGPQVLWLGALFFLATLLSFGLITWFAAALGRALRRSAALQRGMNRATGLVFLGLAAKLVTAQR
jgi:threonine/homoserine/homoserine lactone efflux protein